MSGGREATGEQLLLVHEGASYDEVYLSGHGPEEGSSWSSEREPSAYSPDDKEDFDEKGVEEEDEYDEGNGDGSEDKGDRRASKE